MVARLATSALELVGGGSIAVRGSVRDRRRACDVRVCGGFVCGYFSAMRPVPSVFRALAAAGLAACLELACSAVPDIRFDEDDAAADDGGTQAEDTGAQEDGGENPLCAAAEAAGATACCGEIACFGACTPADCAQCACAFGEFCCSRSVGGTSCRPATASTNVCR